MDAHRLANYFQKNGWVLTRNAGEADLNLLTTCAYIQEHIMRVCRLLMRYGNVELPGIIQREIRERPEAEG